MKKLMIIGLVAAAAVGAFAAPKSTTITLNTKAGDNVASNSALYCRGEVKSVVAWNDNGATGTVVVVNGAAGLTMEQLFSATISAAATPTIARFRHVGTTVAGVALTAVAGPAAGTNTPSTVLVAPYEAPYSVGVYATVDQSSGPADVWHVMVVFDDNAGL